MNTSITGEIEQLFHINLQGYRKTSLDAVIEASKTDPSELSLIELVNKSCSRDCIGEPVTYVNSNNGYIFYKESNGTNVAITVKKKDTWVIVKKSVQDGNIVRIVLFLLLIPFLFMNTMAFRFCFTMTFFTLTFRFLFATTFVKIIAFTSTSPKH